jgi:hypothetical protein
VTATLGAISYMFDHYDFCPDSSSERPIVVSLVCVAAFCLGAATWFAWRRNGDRRAITGTKVLLGVLSPLFVIVWLVLVSVKPITGEC